MFFPERIQLLPTDRILEVGPGASPHPRSQILLEKRFPEPEATRQRGGLAATDYSKPVVYYEGGCLPFANLEFDYAICSHVVEHVEDVEQFVAELSRVAVRGYLEFPTTHYEYLYNFKEHLNFVWYNGNELLWMPKIETSLAEFGRTQQFFRALLEKGHDDVIQAFKEYFFQGFEWSNSIPVRRARDVNELIPPISEIRARTKREPSGKDLLNHFLKRLVHRLKSLARKSN
jgi:hypothetical protein